MTLKGYLPPEGPQNVHRSNYQYSPTTSTHRFGATSVRSPPEIILTGDRTAHRNAKQQGLREVPEDVAREALDAYQSDGEDGDSENSVSDVVDSWRRESGEEKQDWKTTESGPQTSMRTAPEGREPAYPDAEDDGTDGVPEGPGSDADIGATDSPTGPTGEAPGEGPEATDLAAKAGDLRDAERGVGYPPESTDDVERTDPNSVAVEASGEVEERPGVEFDRDDEADGVDSANESDTDSADEGNAGDPSNGETGDGSETDESTAPDADEADGDPPEIPADSELDSMNKSAGDEPTLSGLAAAHGIDTNQSKSDLRDALKDRRDKRESDE